MAKNPFDSEYAQWFRVADTGVSLGSLTFTGSQHPAFVYSFRLAVAPRFGYCLIGPCCRFCLGSFDIAQRVNHSEENSELLPISF